jgi:uncharacterized membrane protein
MVLEPSQTLAAATALFVSIHAVPATALRRHIVGRIGEWPYLLCFSVASIACVVLMAHAYVHAPSVQLFPALRPAAWLLMAPALFLLVCGVSVSNPTALKQEHLLRKAEPARGVIRITRHPVTCAIILFGAAHVLSRGDSRAALFFGGFAVLGIGGIVLQERRKARALGRDWARFAERTSILPGAAIFARRNSFQPREIGWVRAFVALSLYVLLLHFHGSAFGLPAY